MASGGVEAAESPVKQCITVLEKKIRNLEKRKGKLDQYRQSLKNTELNKDQKDALAKYDVVLQNIDFAKELQKQFFEISADTEKAQKKTAKREKMERHQQELLRLQDVLRLNSILNALGNDNVREDFRAGRNTSLVLTDDQLSQLDDCYQMFFPSREVDQTEEVFTAQLSSASDHLVCYIDHQDKKVSNTTYKELHGLIDRIGKSGYFDRLSKVDPEIQPSEETPPVDEHYEEQLAVESKNAAAEESLDLADGANSDALNDISLSVGQPVHYHSTHWSHSPVLVTQQQPAVMATTGVIAMATAQVDRPQPSGFSDGAYYSGFAKQRPLQEIVSSLQGSYNFLQESQIDAEGGHAQGQGQSDVVFNSYDNQSGSGHPPLPPFNAPQQTTPLDQSATIHASQPHFDHDPSQPGAPIYPGSTAGGAYGVQGLHNVYGHHQIPHEPGYDPNYGQIDKTQYNFMDQQTFVLAQMNPGGDPTSHVASAAGPQPIPLPSQAIHGRSLTEQGFGAQQQSSAEISEAMAKKQFTMNPNADIFRSVYDETSAMPSGDHMKSSEIPPQSVGDGQLRTFAQTAGTNFQVGGGNRGFGSSFGSGGPPRGSGPSRGGRGAKDPVFNNGIQSGGGRGGGPSNGSRGTVPNMGTAGQRGGTRGVPPRGGNSHVRGGGGGGGGRGFGRNSEQQSSHEQATHA